MVEISKPIPDNEKAHAAPDASGDASASGEKIGTFSSLHIHNFRMLLTGTTLANAAGWIQQVTLSWLVYDLTGSGTVLGSISVVGAVASLGMIPVAGVLIDRFNRRRLMLFESGWLFTITLGLGIVLIFGRPHIYHLFVFTLLGGLISTITATLRQVVVFDLVPRSHTPNAVALIQTGWSLMRTFGPGIGGFLILWVGPGGNFIFQACAYALIAVTILKIQFPPGKPVDIRSSALHNIKEGIQYMAKGSTARTFMLIGFILPLFFIPIFNILTPIYAKDVFHGGSNVLGLLMSSVGVGGIAGGVVTASLGRIERRGLVQLASLFLLSITLIGFAFTTTLWTAFVLMAWAGFFETIFQTTNQTLLQLSIPDNLRGRITSVVNLNYIVFSMGALIAGSGSDLLGGPRMITIILCIIAAIIAVCIYLGSPGVRNYRLSRAIETDSANMSADSGS